MPTSHVSSHQPQMLPENYCLFCIYISLFYLHSLHSVSFGVSLPEPHILRTPRPGRGRWSRCWRWRWRAATGQTDTTEKYRKNIHLIYLSIYLSIFYIFIYLSVFLSIYTYIHQSIYLIIYPCLWTLRAQESCELRVLVRYLARPRYLGSRSSSSWITHFASCKSVKSNRWNNEHCLADSIYELYLLRCGISKVPWVYKDVFCRNQADFRDAYFLKQRLEQWKNEPSRNFSIFLSCYAKIFSFSILKKKR